MLDFGFKWEHAYHAIKIVLFNCFEIEFFVFCLEKLCNQELHFMSLVSFNDEKENENYKQKADYS